MECEKLTCTEFKTRIFKESIPRIIKCLNLIDSEQLWKTPNDQITSIGCSIQHVVGNARQWVLSGVLGEKESRIRSKEFVQNKELNQSDLIRVLDKLEKDLSLGLEKITEERIKRKVEIQGFSVTGFSALIHVIEHFSYHTGQITLLAKMYSGENTDYYGEFDLE